MKLKSRGSKPAHWTLWRVAVYGKSGFVAIAIVIPCDRHQSTSSGAEGLTRVLIGDHFLNSMVNLLDNFFWGSKMAEHFT